MKAMLRSFWLPKQGNTDNECEDAFWPRIEGARYGHSLRFSIADGATENIFSRQWAQQLVALYAATSNSLPIEEGFTTFQKNVHIAARKWSANALSKGLSWHALKKLEQGAFASLLGLNLQGTDAKAGHWSAFAIGDSCLFQIHDEELQVSWPITRSEEFGYHPILLGTDPAYNTILWETPDQWMIQRKWRTQDIFCLMTDALAHWFLSQHEANNSPWSLLSRFETEDDFFSEWVATQRQNGQLRNDDVTLLIIRIGNQA